MEVIIDQIEKFLRGQMSQEEESVFKSSLAIDEHLRSLAFILTNMLRMQKTGLRFGNFNNSYYICSVDENRSSS